MIVAALSLLAMQATPVTAPLSDSVPYALSATASIPLSEPRPIRSGLKDIPGGTLIELLLTETISTKTHVKGDIFELTVSKPLSLNGHEILPIGSKVIGEVTRSETKAAFGISGKLEARLLYAVLPEGTLRLNGKLAARGKGGTTETVLTYAAIGAIAFVVTGKSATIEKGTELVGVTEPR